MVNFFYKDRGNGVGSMKKKHRTHLEPDPTAKKVQLFDNNCRSLSLKSKMRKKKRWCDFMCVFTLAAAHVIH